MSAEGPARRARPLFVARETYRRRRLRDAARALPVLGLLLWMVPLLWPLNTEAVSASGALVFLFTVWAGLVIVAGALVSAMNATDRGAAVPDPLADEDDEP
ncbi:hypothetical protein [Thetidibacter halocola]|uniref:Uncharacterized protein n=1 Tax=Thetidibacter halocola TaxID=2827239 RepID=A0A8J7WFI8_9RHOB|nr:hypothetical protein [Thetidibacter halocola]MBS0126742.1 hypothetical protein [Thetidibacter halocola]